MSTILNETGRFILDLLTANERLQSAIKHSKRDIADSIQGLYSSTLKLINKVVDVDLKTSRLFRLKYHHILSSESVEEYLFHCISTILCELMDEENQHHRFIQPVAELHGKLSSIISQLKLHVNEIVCANSNVQQEMQQKSLFEEESNRCNEAKFLPIYYQSNNHKLKKAQSLTSQAIIEHYSCNVIDPVVVAMLIEFDRSFAEFELAFVCQANPDSIISKESAEMTMDVAILFAEAVRWAHCKGLLQYSAIADCDIEIMVGIPRLSVLYGCRVVNEGPLSDWSLFHRHSNDSAGSRLAPVFQGHFMELGRLRRQLNVLNYVEIAYLSRLLLDTGDISDKAVVGNGSLSCLDDHKYGDKRYPISGDVHALFKLIASVSDQMQSEHASDYRFFMEVIYKLYKDEPDDVPLSDEDIDDAVEAICFENDEPLNRDKEVHFKSLLDIRSCNASLKNVQQATNRLKNALPIIVDCNIQFNRPLWQPSSSFRKCCHCGSNFNLFRRGRHCRRCGYLFCNSCWGAKTTIPTLGIHTKVPVCVECEEFIRGRDRVLEASS